MLRDLIPERGADRPDGRHGDLGTACSDARRRDGGPHGHRRDADGAAAAVRDRFVADPNGPAQAAHYGSRDAGPRTVDRI